MQQNDLMDLLMLEKKIYNSLNEVQDLTRQLAEALDRQDQVSVRMLLTMRQEPIDVIQDVQGRLLERQIALGGEDAARLRALLQGGAPAGPAEQPLAEQIATNRRLLEKVVEQDRRLSQRLGGKASYYHEP